MFLRTESIYFVLSFSSAEETAAAISRKTISQKCEFFNFKEDTLSLLLLNVQSKTACHARSTAGISTALS